MAILPRLSAREASLEGEAVLAPRTVNIARVKNAKNLVTKKGERIRIASIQAPNRQEKSGKRRPGQPMGEEATQALMTLVEGKSVRLEVSTKEPVDRLGRTVALVTLPDDELLQAQLIMDGWAIAYPFADHRSSIRQWQVLERQARAAKRGIWAEPYWQPVAALNLPQQQEEERYLLVEGVVKEAKEVRGNWYLNFDDDYRTDFTGFISKKDVMHYFTEIDIAAYVGKRLRIRGWVYRRNGPAIDISLPEQIEVLK